MPPPRPQDAPAQLERAPFRLRLANVALGALTAVLAPFGRAGARATRQRKEAELGELEAIPPVVVLVSGGALKPGTEARLAEQLEGRAGVHKVTRPA